MDARDRSTPARTGAAGAAVPRGELRAIAAIAAPLAAAYLAEMAMGFTDTAMVGRLGALELAAVGLSANVLFGFLFVCMGSVSLVGVMVAEANAVGERERVGAAVRQGMWVALAVALPATWAGYNLAPLLRLLGQDEAVVRVAEQYLHAAVWCFLPYMWFTVLRNFVSALSRAGSVLAISVAAVALNALANYALVFGKFGAPALGVAGSGYATSLVCWAMFLALLVYCLRERTLGAYRIARGLLRIDWAVCRAIFRPGLAVAGASAVETGLFSAVALLMGVLGATTLAANQIANSFWSIIYVVPYGISLAVGYRVAHLASVGDIAMARRSGHVAIAASTAYMVVVAALMWILPQAIAGIYLDAGDPANAPVLALAVDLLAIAAVFQVVDGIQVIATGALRGLRDVTVPFLVGLVGYWAVGLGSGYLFAFELGHGGRGLWWGLALGLAAAAVLLAWRFRALTAAVAREG